MREMKRIYYTWDKWECFPAGMFNPKPPKGVTAEQALETYRRLLTDIPYFETVLGKVITEWQHSCEHNLTNTSLNRIAWLGQASLAYEFGIPSQYRGGFSRLTEEQQQSANASALKYLNKWLAANDYPTVTEDKPTTVAQLY